MPARHPVRPVRSGPSGLSGPGALGLGRWSGPDGPDRTGHGRHCALAKSTSWIFCLTHLVSAYDPGYKCGNHSYNHGIPELNKYKWVPPL